jgi:toxin FitB
MLFVLDTNVISELMRPAPAQSVMNWFAKQSSADFATTAINQAEILGGLAQLSAGKRKRDLLAAAQAIWSEDLQNRVLPFDALAAQALGQIMQARKTSARPIAFADAAIAATCKVHQASIVTRDVSGFAGTGIKIINPWD